MRTVAGLLNILLGVALAFAVATVVHLDFPDWGGLVSAAPAALGIPVLVASVLALLVNRRAYSSAGS